MCDITDKEFQDVYLPFYNNLDLYLNEYVIPDVVAFYISNMYYRKCLQSCSIYSHINSALDIFNVKCDIDKLIPKVKEILKIKYNLIIKNTNPLLLKQYK